MTRASQPTEELSDLRRAAVALQRLRARLDKAEGAAREPIAIIGMSCRFPGGVTDPASYWRLLLEGRDVITEVPAERWDVDAYYDPRPATPGKMYTRHGGFLDRVELFDPQFFGIAPREALTLDPQQRLLLEVSWEALERAGLARDRLEGTETGVFVGITTNDYARLLTNGGDLDHLDSYFGTGNMLNSAAGRLSYFLGLHGPSLAVDTACSSSLVAAHLACQSLRMGESSMALVGGVNLILAPEATIALSQARMLAADGRCKTFDARADGYVRGEGCGVVLLKRRSDALADGDRILALIRGTAVNQDGASSGLTVPNANAQRALLRRALRQARVKPAEVDYVEAHGTGTFLGDPTEVSSLAAELGAGRAADRPLLVGSVKTNIGHLEAAAGVAGLIKVVLALQHGTIPPQLHLQQPNPHIRWDELPVRAVTTATSWPSRDRGGSRTAGVSSFGASGTNAHLVLEAPPAAPPRPAPVSGARLLVLSARSPEALAELKRRYLEWLDGDSVPPLSDICFTANAGRTHFEHRLAASASSVEELRTALAAASGRQVAPRRTKIAFLFTGQGSLYPGMGRQLHDAPGEFRHTLSECEEILRPHLERPLLEVLFAPPGPESSLRESIYAQPALFALEIALARLWQSWGVAPSVLLGHSLGEYAAATVAGVFSLEDGLRLVAERARLMQGLERPGAMLAVWAEPKRVEEVLSSRFAELSVAALNGPRSVVISGSRRELEAIGHELREQGVHNKRLPVSHGFHSPLMEPMVEEFERFLGGIEMSPPRIPLISGLTGRQAGEEVATADYWCRQLRQPVRFAAGVETLAARGCAAFIEIGPQPTLLALARRCLEDQAILWLPSLRRGTEDRRVVLDSLGRLYQNGAGIDWRGFHEDEPHRLVESPTYPFQRSRYWVEPRSQVAEDWFYRLDWVGQELAAADRSAGPGRWMILADRGGLGEALSERLQQQGERPVLVYASTAGDAGGLRVDDPTASDAFRELLESQTRPLSGIVHLWSLDTASGERLTVDELERAQALGCGSVPPLIRGLAGREESPKLWLVTRGAVAVRGESSLEVGQAPLWGVGKVVALEHPELWGGLLDLDSAAPREDAVEALAAILVDGAGEDHLAMRDGRLYAGRLARAAPDPSNGLTVRRDGSYLITGGLGALGLRLAGWLAARGAGHLVLLGRSRPSTSAEQTLSRLRQEGARITVARADVADLGSLTEVWSGTAPDAPPWRGVIHAAGVLQDGLLLRQSWQDLRTMLAPKMKGGWNLHLLSRDQPLDFFILFSSQASLLGSPGQGSYAAANAFLDALAAHRHAKGLPATSINWGPWADSGMAARLGDSYRRTLASWGVTPLPHAQALRSLDRLPRLPQVAVTSLDRGRLAHGAGGAGRSLLRDWAAPATSPPPSTDEELLGLRRSPTELRPKLLSDYLRKLVGETLGLDELRPEQPLSAMGLDSLMALNLRQRLRTELGVEVAIERFLSGVTLNGLAVLVGEQMETADRVAVEAGADEWVEGEL